jgi:hypothetical protein
MRSSSTSFVHRLLRDLMTARAAAQHRVIHRLGLRFCLLALQQPVSRARPDVTQALMLPGALVGALRGRRQTDAL